MIENGKVNKNSGFTSDCSGQVRYNSTETMENGKVN